MLPIGRSTSLPVSRRYGSPDRAGNLGSNKQMPKPVLLLLEGIGHSIEGVCCDLEFVARTNHRPLA